MVSLIYSDTQLRDAEDILRFLTEWKGLPLSSRRSNCIVLQSDSRITQDSAIILISSAAIEDEEWQTLVSELSDEVHIIPVCSTKNEDYVVPKKIPSRVKEINYIYMDGMYLENIWDSLTTDPEFYKIKSALLLNKSVWLFSHCSEDFLLTDRKIIQEYLQIFQEKHREETSTYFRNELAGILDYLGKSLNCARELHRKKIIDWSKRAAAAVIGVIFIVLFLKILTLTSRLKATQTIIDVGTLEALAPINSIKLVDGITNPFISEDKRLALYNTLSEHLNANWHHTPIGGAYKWALNGAQIAADERHLWSCNGNGNIAKWDTYTGQITQQENVSDQPLLTLAVSALEDLFVVIDFDGYLFKKVDEGPWERSARPYDIPIYSETKLICSSEANWAVVSGAKGKLMWFDLQPGISLLWEAQVDEVFCAELTSQGLEAIVRKDGVLCDLQVRADGTTDELRIPIDCDDVCTMDIRNGTVIMADSHFQVVTWNRADPSTIHPAGIMLSRPLHLCFVSETVIACYDRNSGTHLYDLNRKLDLGPILKHLAVVSSLSASQNTVMAYALGIGTYNTEHIKALLPLDRLDSPEAYTVYRGQEGSSQGRIQEARIEQEYIIHLVLRLEDRELALNIDGGNRFYIGESQRDSSLVQGDSMGASYYVDRPVSFVGRPTVIGITHSGDTLLVGSSDGSFFEVTFTESGYWLMGAKRQVPSHAAITAIYQTPDCYYLEDATGTYWSVRIGYDCLTPEGAVAAVKERLHYAATEEIHELVSKQTLEALDVAIMPGGGTKEWE